MRRGDRWRLWTARVLGALLLLAGLGLMAALTGDAISLVMARHTIQHQIEERAGGWITPPDPATLPTGALTGTVTDAAGLPISSAVVIAADRRGVAYRTATDTNGRYLLDGLPAANYRPVAAAPGHGPVADAIVMPTGVDALGVLRWRPAVSVREGQTRAADLQFTPPSSIAPLHDAEFTFGPEEEVEQGDPFPAQGLRQTFTLTTRWRVTEGIIYAPRGGGQHPTVVVIYPGPPASWENVSLAIASGGFTVVAYFPQNLPAFERDVAELLALTHRLTTGALTGHALPGRQCVAGGSFSTLWAFLLLRETDAYQCVLSLGGISDAFLYRQDWEAGLITPDPTLAPVPELMAALGRPDLAPDLYLWFSTVEHTTPLPSALLVHGSGDTIVPINQSVVLHERMTATGQASDLVLYDGMEHYLDAAHATPDTHDLLARTHAFFRQHLSQ